VARFSSVPVYEERLPRVGVVGEIYVKYNTFVNGQMVQWLMDQQIEVLLPPLLTFFLGSFVGSLTGVKAGIRRPDWLWGFSTFGRWVVESVADEAEAVLRRFRHYQPHGHIGEIARAASAAVQLTHQYGEGWLLPGEVGEFARTGVKNVLCLQPFGCIANHVIAKGMARR
jgi:predicted nucleotide-binding protein (sugar kinase/HSP70/actin superfamily)